MAKDLPAAKIIGHADPNSDTQKRIQQWHRESNPTVKDLVDFALEAVRNSNEIGHRVKSAQVPECALDYAYATRVWRAEDTNG